MSGPEVKESRSMRRRKRNKGHPFPESVGPEPEATLKNENPDMEDGEVAEQIYNDAQPTPGLLLKCLRLKCKEEFGSMSEARQHLSNDHWEIPESLTYCPVCGLLFTKNSFMKRHRRKAHPTQDQLTCRLCQKEFQTPGGRRNHVKSSHLQGPGKAGAEEEPGKSEQGETPTKFRRTKKGVFCRICRNNFQTQTDFEIHEKKVHQKRCQIPGCELIFETTKKLNRHVESHSQEKGGV